jgi:hypothetical protein
VDRALDLQGTGYGSFAPVDGYANNHIVENISISQTKGVTAAIESQQFTALPHRLVVLRNIFSFNCASSKSWDQAINSVMNRIENCADDDGSLAVAIAGGFTNYSDVFSNVDDALEIESFDDTNSDFLHLKKGALAVSANATPDKGKAPLRVRFNSDIDYLWPAGMQLYNGGAVPSLSVNDIAGEQYGKYGDYPIGCHNAEVAY